jgi:hypothetical protein
MTSFDWKTFDILNRKMNAKNLFIGGKNTLQLILTNFFMLLFGLAIPVIWGEWSQMKEIKRVTEKYSIKNSKQSINNSNDNLIKGQIFFSQAHNHKQECY